jgi:hypothetical protein
MFVYIFYTNAIGLKNIELRGLTGATLVLNKYKKCVSTPRTLTLGLVTRSWLEVETDT